MAHFTESDEMQFTNTLLAAMKDSEFAGIDFSPLPTAQAGMDEVFIKILRKTDPTERKRLYALLLDSKISNPPGSLLWQLSPPGLASSSSAPSILEIRVVMS